MHHVASIKIDPDTVRQAARGVETAAQDLQSALSQLQTTVTTDNPWGGDDAGSIFGTLYVAALSQALDALGSHDQKLDEAAQGLAAWAQQLAQTEQGNTTLISQSGGQ